MLGADDRHLQKCCLRQRKGKKLARSYWDYYKGEYTWNDEGRFPIDQKLTEDSFSKIGFDDAQVQDLMRSGYIVLGDLVVDRYYGGRLLSCDFRSRIRLDQFREEPVYKSHPARVYHASSIADLRDQIDKWQKASARRLIFRGQPRSYPVNRIRPNPAYAVDEFGEISLIPTLWREMLRRGNIGPENFTNLSVLEWSKILYSDFDLAEVERRQQDAIDRGEWIYSAQDMEDSDDPVLHEFGKRRLDVIMGLDYDLNVQTQTLLQHYSLLSPLLDLTSDLDVALFFATHKFSKDDQSNRSTYEFISTHNRQSLLYILQENSHEMGTHEHHRALETFKPQRPVNQSCVVALGGMDALNLPLEFLFGVIVLDFDDISRSKYAIETLFPVPNEIGFLLPFSKIFFIPNM